MRIVIGFMAIFAIAGCASPEMQRMQQACAAGDWNACQAAEDARMNRARLMMGAGAAIQQQLPPRPAPQTTRCRYVGQTLVCDSF